MEGLVALEGFHCMLIPTYHWYCSNFPSLLTRELNREDDFPPSNLPFQFVFEDVISVFPYSASHHLPNARQQEIQGGHLGWVT